MALTLAMLMFLAAAPGEPTPPRARLFALVIGNNHAEDASSPELKFADDDALALHHLLLEAGVRSVLLARLDDQTRALHPEEPNPAPPSQAALTSAWEQVRSELDASIAAGHAAELVLFFSGHGDISNGEGFLTLEGGRLTRSALQAMLAASPAHRNHVIIDACKAYFAVLARGPGGTRAPYPAAFAAGSAPSRSGFLLSTSSDGDSHEWERYQAGIFSFEVRSGLRGSADVNGDGRVTYGELGGFLSRANAGIANTRFRPDFLVVPPGGGSAGLDEAVLTWPLESTALTLEGEASHLYVEGSVGDRLLEVNAAARQPFLLHLPNERPLFIRTVDEREERILESASRTSLSSLPINRPAVRGKGALHLAFSHLFSQPFDASAVHSFVIDYAVREREAPVTVDWKAGVRRAAPFVAGGAGLVGLAAIVVAVERSSVTNQTSQLERVSRNDGIIAANVTIGVAGGVAAAALGSWVVLSLLNSTASPHVEVAVGPGAASIAVVGRW